MNTEEIQGNPNCTIMLPGSCSARCSFCFWDRTNAIIPTPEDYLGKVRQALFDLPEEFKTYSISGGEPTESPYLDAILAMLSHCARKRVVLTTNGSGLLELLAFNSYLSVINFLNISRHHYDDQENEKIFNSTAVPNTPLLKKIIRQFDCEHEIKTTLNCVINTSTTSDFIWKFLAYAHKVNASAVCFRSEAGVIDPTPVEQKFVELFGSGEENGCPVCRSRVQSILGYSAIWKGSVLEPSITQGKVYEVIIFPDGKAYADWGGTVPLSFPGSGSLKSSTSTGPFGRDDEYVDLDEDDLDDIPPKRAREQHSSRSGFARGPCS